ncbi:MAG: acetylserotonin O-methyltransferase [Nostoc sp. LLA-1]|nr:acetylserotonin O-methyltransferase [Cyanocohniella sp. LLY]
MNPEVAPQEIVMQMLVGAWVSQTISTITRLDIPDLIKCHGPQSAMQLTQVHGVKADTEFLSRVLRACASVGVFTEDADGKFGATPLSDVLTLDSSVSVKKLAEIFGGTWWQIWAGFPDALTTGQPQTKNQLGMEYWDYCQANPKEMADFGAAMQSNSLNSLRGVLKHCDLSESKKVADIGGGFGHLALELVRKYPHLHGIVLDIPDLIPIAKSKIVNEPEDIIDRIQFIGGDMFEDVPAADVYIMKLVIHDWDDAKCIQLLKNCHARMEGNGRIICVDAVLPPIGNVSGTAAKFLDINMMISCPGKERTEEQWQYIYSQAGWKITSIQPIYDNYGTSIVEGIKS